MKELIIDSREKDRKALAKSYFESQGYNVEIKELPTGDYLFNDKVVMEFKLWNDFMSSIVDGRLWNESQKQMENYDIHFVVIHGTNRDYQEAFQHNGLTDEMITGAIARLNTYTKILHGTRTIQDTFEMMMTTAEKCLDDKTLCRQFGTKSVNPAFNVLAYCVDDIKGERAKAIVNTLGLKTFKDVCRLTQTDLMKVPGIGEVLSKKIMDAIGQ